MSEMTGFDQDTAPEPMPELELNGLADSGQINMPSEVVAPDDQEIDINAALTEAQDSDESITAPSEKKAETAEEILDKIVPQTEPKSWSFGPPDMPLTYVQRRLSFVGKMQWFALVGSVMDKAMSGPEGVSVSELLEGPIGQERDTASLTMSDFREADTFVRAIGKLAIHTPSFIVDSYCIWLGVPEHQRPLVKEIMALHSDDGGLSDDMGLEIIEVFIDQNYEALAEFFTGKLSKLGARIRAANAERNAKNAS